MGEYKVKKNKKKKRNRIIAVFIFLLLMAYFILQYNLVNNSRIEQVEAMEGYINDSYITNGIVLREEVVLSGSFQGEVDFIVEEGQRVSSGDKIADVYPTAADIDNVAILNSSIILKEELLDVNNNKNPGSSEISMSYRNLMDNIIELANMQNTNGFSSVDEEIIDISVDMNKLYLATNEIDDLSNVISLVDSSIVSLSASISPITTSLYSTTSGYFIKSTDGYENIATFENFSNFSKEEGQNIISKAVEHSPSDAEYGKIVTDYRWYVAAYIPKEIYDELNENESIDISIDNNDSILNCKINTLEKKDDEYLIILEASEDAQNAEIERIVDLEIIFRRYEGIKIPKEALRVIDGNLGVYVNFSEIAEFKNITPIYEDENYFILPIEGDENNEVKLYDDIIINGRNLYDGKYI